MQEWRSLVYLMALTLLGKHVLWEQLGKFYLLFDLQLDDHQHQDHRHVVAQPLAGDEQRTHEAEDRPARADRSRRRDAARGGGCGLLSFGRNK